MQTDTPGMIETEEETATPPPSDAEVAASDAEVTTYDIGEWRGRELVDRNGERIGRLEEVYFDIETEEPQFGTVKEGFVGRHLTFVPLTGITIGPDNLEIPVTAEQVKNAPNIALHGGELSQSDESALYHHYELNYTPPDNKSGRRLARR
jgi:sporulation protein YlmC with PRC-barrel domain